MKRKMNWLKIVGSMLLTCLIVGCTQQSDSIFPSQQPSSEHTSDDASSENNPLSSSIEEERLIRHTEYGDVKGYREDETLIWRGIPYAADTSGINRWTEPVDPIAWQDVRDATQPGQPSLQFNGTDAVGSESPQNLDIYRPNSDAEKLPVLVYIHGTDNVKGSSSDLSGISFVEAKDVIVVSINYRLGVLGFNPLQALKTGTPEENSGNYALLDIHKALIWVQNNIAEFGGDATNITVAGFASGGRNVMAMLISPMFDGTFDRAVVFSGGMTIADEKESQEVFAQAFAPLVVEDGLQPNEYAAYQWLLSSDPAVQQYLYGLTSERLAKVMSNPAMRMKDFPHLYRDGLVIPEEGFNTRRFNPVPLLLVTGEHEFSLVAHQDAYFAPHVASGAIHHDPTIVAQYQFTKKHAGQLYHLFNIQEPAAMLYENYQADMYALEIQYGANSEWVSNPLNHFGAFQGNVLPLLDPKISYWQDIIGDSYQTEGAQELTELFQQYLYEFMRDGNPNGDGLPVWDKWTPNASRPTMMLNATQTDVIAEMNKAYTSEEVLQEIALDNGIDATAKEIILTQVLKDRWFSEELDKIYSPLVIRANIHYMVADTANEGESSSDSSNSQDVTQPQENHEGVDIDNSANIDSSSTSSESETSSQQESQSTSSQENSSSDTSAEQHSSSSSSNTGE